MDFHIISKIPMKSYTKLGLQERMEMSQSSKDRFMTYAKHRVKHLMENHTMNERVHALFQGKTESSINSILEHFFQDNFTKDYESLVESFNRYTETKSEATDRMNTILENFSIEVQKNPFFPASHKILDEAIRISPSGVLNYLINEGCNVLSYIDVRSQFDKNLFESASAKSASLVIKDEPKYVLGLAESLSRSISYVLPFVQDLKESQKGIKFLESLNNIYSIYKEGMDLVATQEYQASELFDMFMTDRAPAYHFSIHRLNLHLKDPASFVQCGLRFLNTWVNKYRTRLSYKFPIDNFTRLEEMFNIYEANHPMLNSKKEYTDSFYYNFQKMYSLLDLLHECSQMLRMDLRNLVCKYISVIRPMVDSYRQDFQRSHIRTGY